MAKNPSITYELQIDLKNPENVLKPLEAALTKTLSKVDVSEKIFAPIAKGSENAVKEVQKARVIIAKSMGDLITQIEASWKGKEILPSQAKSLEGLKQLQEAMHKLSQTPVVSQKQVELLAKITDPRQFQTLTQEQQRNSMAAIGSLEQQLKLMREIERVAKNAGMMTQAGQMAALSVPVKQYIATNTPATNLYAAEKRAEKQRIADELKAISDANKERERLEKERQQRERFIANQRLSDLRADIREEERLEKERLANLEKLHAQQARLKADALKNAAQHQLGGELFNRGIGTLDKHELRPVKDYLTSSHKQAVNEYGIAKLTGTAADVARAQAAVTHYGTAIVELNRHQRELGGTMTMLNGLFQNFTRYALGYGALYQLTGAISATTREVVQFDKQMRSLQAVSEATDHQLLQISTSIKEIAKNSSFSMNELAEGAKTLAQAGVAAEDLGTALSATEKFARATETSMSTAADLITTYRDVYKELNDATIADQLTKAVNISKLTGEDLRTILSLGASTAKDFGIASEQFLGAVATLRNAGIKASTAATGLRQSMLEVFNLDDKALGLLKERYKQMGEQISEAAIKEMFFNFSKGDNPLLAVVTELKRIGFGGEGQPILGRAFDIRSINVLSSLVANIDSLVTNEKKLTFGGAAAQAAETQMRSLSNSLTRLQNQFLVIGEDMSTGLVAGLKSAVDYASELLHTVEEINKEAKRKGDANAGGASMELGGAAAIAAFGATGKMGMFKRVLTTAGAFAGGTAAGEGIVASGGSTDLVGGITGALLLFQSFKGVAGLLRGAGATISTGVVAATETVGLVSRIAAFFTAIRTAAAAGSLAGGVGLLASNPVGWGVAAIATIGGLLYGLNEIYQATKTESLTEKLARLKTSQNQASADAAVSLAKYRETESNRSGYRLATDSKPADSGSFAAMVGEFRKDLKDVDLLYTEYLGKYNESAGQIKTLLLSLSDAATVDEKKRILDQIKKLAANPSEGLTVKDAEALAAEVRGVQDTYQAFVESFRQRVAQLNEKIAQGGEVGEAARKELALMERVKNLKELILNPSNFSPKDMEKIAVEFANTMHESFSKAGTEMAQAETDAMDNAVKQVQVAITSNMTPVQLTAALMGIQDAFTGLEYTAAQRAAKVQQAIRIAEENLKNEQQNDIGFWGKLTDSLGLSNNQYMKDSSVRSQQRNLSFMKRQEDAIKKENETQEKKAKEAEAAALQTKAKSAFSSLQEEGNLDAAAKFLKQSSPTDARALREAYAAMRDGNASDKQKTTLSSLFEKVSPTLAKRDTSPDFSPSADEITKKGNIDVRIEQLKGKDEYSSELNDLIKQSGQMELDFQSRKIKQAEYELSQQDKGTKEYTDAAAKLADEKLRYEQMRSRNEKDLYDITDRGAKFAEKTARDRFELEAKMAKTGMDHSIREAVYAARNGGVDSIKSLEAGFSADQKKALDAFTGKLRLDGASEDDIKEQIRNRDDLTRSLMSQKQVVEALEKAWAREDRVLEKRATRGPTTGDVNRDAILAAQGVGLSRDQKLAGLKDNYQAFSQRIDNTVYHQQVTEERLNNEIAIAQAQGDSAKVMDLQKEIQDKQLESSERILDLDRQRAEVVGKVYELTTNIDKEMRAAFSANKLRSTLDESSSSIKNYGRTVRGELVSAWESVGDAISGALTEGKDLGEELRNTLHELSKEFLKTTLRTGMNQLGDKLLGKTEGEAPQPGLMSDLWEGTKRLFGFGSEAGPDQVNSADLGQTVAGKAAAAVGKMAGPQNITTPVATVKAGMVTVIGGTDPAAAAAAAAAGGAAAPGAPAGPAGAPASGGGFLSGIMNLFSSEGPIATGFTNLFGQDGPLATGLGGLFQGLLGSVFGGGGSGVSGPSGTQIAGQVLSTALMAWAGGAAGGGGAAAAAAAANGGVIRGFSRGGWVEPPGIIRGSGSGTSDSIRAVGVGRRGANPILVSNGEAILTARATQFLGKGFIDSVNSGKIVRHATGRFARESGEAQQGVSSGLSKIGLGGHGGNKPIIVKVPITNVMDPSVTKDYVESRAGSKTVVNKLKKLGVI